MIEILIFIMNKFKQDPEKSVFFAIQKGAFFAMSML